MSMIVAYYLLDELRLALFLLLPPDLMDLRNIPTKPAPIVLQYLCTKS